MLFWDLLSTLPCYFTVYRAGSQLKTIAIFAYKQLGLSMDIETKICSACPESQGIELDN